MGAFGVASDVFYAREIGLAYKISAGSDTFFVLLPAVLLRVVGESENFFEKSCEKVWWVWKEGVTLHPQMRNRGSEEQAAQAECSVQKEKVLKKK